MKKVDIITHENKIRIIDINVGDQLMRPKKRGRGIVKDVVTEVTDGTVWFRNHGYSNTIIQEINNVEEIELVSSDFEIVMQKGITDKEYFQIIFNHKKGIKKKERPFSLCYITDRGVLSDWTEHNVASLPNPVKVGHKAEGNKIIEINV